MKNPIMTDLAYGMVEDILRMDSDKIAALRQEIKNDYPKSKLSYVIEDLLEGIK